MHKKMSEELDCAILIGLGDAEYPRICISNTEFVIGRSVTASFIIRNVLISKIQCIFHKADSVWTVIDKSSFGTFLNEVKLEKCKPTIIKDGDTIQFGPTHKFIYKFQTDNKSPPAPPSKKMKMNDHITLEQQKMQEEKLDTKYRQYENKLKDSHQKEEDKFTYKSNIIHLDEDRSELQLRDHDKTKLEQEKLIQEKMSLEEKLKEMERILEEKEKAQEELNKRLEEKEQERLRDLKQLQEQKDAQAQLMLKELKKKVEEKEESLKIHLTKEIQNLQEEKQKLEIDIRGELSKKEGESAENLKRLQDELEKVKRDLTNTESKKQYLEKELEQTTKAKEEASESGLKAKDDVLKNFGELMETELQCSICSELFVTATILNCTHTFCRYCIVEWKKKKKECPICRTPITSENRSLVLDTFIDKMVENLSTELKQRRQEIVEERQVQELLGKNVMPGASENRRSRRNESIRETDIISLSDSSSSSTSSQESLMTDSDFSEDSLIEGDPSEYYGGYGFCFNCGRRGHWARGCPDR